MANYFELTKSVRITTKGPIDGDRYVAATIADRNNLILEKRAHVGLQVYVVDTGSGDPALYVLKTLVSGSPGASVWEVISTDAGVKDFILLDDTPTGWGTADAGGSIVITDVSLGAGNEKLTFEKMKDAFNSEFGLDSEMTNPLPASGTPVARADSAGQTNTVKVAKIDHHHDGRYYNKNDVDAKITNVSAGIKYIWADLADINSQEPSGDYVAGDQGLLKLIGTPPSPPNDIKFCAGSSAEENTVYQYNTAPATDCWVKLYSLGGGNVEQYGDTVELHSGAINTKSIIVSEGLGKYKPNDTISSEEDIYTILKNILEKVIPPAFTPAIILASFSQPTRLGAVEVGSLLGGSANATLDSPGNIVSYVPGSLPTTADVDKVGSSFLSPIMTYISGGYTIQAGNSAVTGEAIIGENSFKVKHKTTSNSVKVYNSDGFENNTIPRFIEETVTYVATGETYWTYGVKYNNTADADPTFPTSKAAITGDTNGALTSIPEVYTGVTLAKNPATIAGSSTWIYVCIIGNYDVAECKQKVKFYDTKSTAQLFEVDDVAVSHYKVLDASGTGTGMDYTTMFVRSGIWSEDKLITITLNA